MEDKNTELNKRLAVLNAKTESIRKRTEEKRKMNKLNSEKNEKRNDNIKKMNKIVENTKKNNNTKTKKDNSKEDNGIKKDVRLKESHKTNSVKTSNNNKDKTEKTKDKKSKTKINIIPIEETSVWIKIAVTFLMLGSYGILLVTPLITFLLVSILTTMSPDELGLTVLIVPLILSLVSIISVILMFKDKWKHVMAIQLSYWVSVIVPVSSFFVASIVR